MVDLLAGKNIKMVEVLSSAEKIDDSVPVVLVVDDDEDNRAMLKTILSIWSYRVIEAANGKEAVSIAEQILPDLILMDVKLPYLDGFDATRQIRESALCGSVPILFLSGCAEKDYRNAGSAAGGNEYLVKPIDFEELRKAIGKYIY